MSTVRIFGLSVGIVCSVILNLPTTEPSYILPLTVWGITGICVLIFDLYDTVKQRRLIEFVKNIQYQIY